MAECNGCNNECGNKVYRFEDVKFTDKDNKLFLIDEHSMRFSPVALEIMARVSAHFQVDCIEVAEKNWCPSQVEMLHRLFIAVAYDIEYADVTTNEDKTNYDPEGDLKDEVESDE